MSDSDSDSDGAPEVISMSAGKKQAEDIKKREIRSVIDINTKKNEKKRKREEAKQAARRKAILPKSVLVSLAEKESKDKEKPKESDQYNDQDSESEESEESEEIAPPPPKKVAISRIVEGGVEVQIQKEAYKKTVVNNSAKDFLQQHFFGPRVQRMNNNSDIVRNPSLFAKNK